MQPIVPTVSPRPVAAVDDASAEAEEQAAGLAAEAAKADGPWSLEDAQAAATRLARRVEEMRARRGGGAVVVAGGGGGSGGGGVGIGGQRGRMVAGHALSALRSMDARKTIPVPCDPAPSVRLVDRPKEWLCSS